jgi:hypothetical protein
LIYKEAKGVFEEIYDMAIEGQEKKAGKHDIYSEFARARKCEAALVAANAEIRSLKSKVSGLENRQVPSNRGARGGGVLQVRGGRGAGGAKGGRGRGAQGQWEEDDAFVAARSLVCMQWNRNIECRSVPCLMQHSCNKKVGWGQICKEAHRGNTH